MRLALAPVFALCLVIHSGSGIFAAGERAASPVQLFVSPGGDDQNPGTLEAPFGTLERARDEIRAIVNANGALPPGGVTVILRGGEYFLERAFQLSEVDSGTSESPIVYRAYDGEVVRLHGSNRLDPGWFRPVDDPEVLSRLPAEARGSVLYADLKAHGFDRFDPLRPYGFQVAGYQPAPQLVIDGTAHVLARWPNDHFARITHVIDGGSVPRSGELPPYRGGVIQLSGAGISERLARWAAASDVWIYGYFYWDWADQSLEVARIEPGTGAIHTAEPSFYGFRDGQRFFVFNLLEELDAPGEWYLDRERGRLYVYAPAPLDRKDIRLTRLLEPLIQLDDASYITFENFIFELSRGKGLVVRGGSHVRVLNSTFRHLADTAVEIAGGRFHELLSSEFHDLGSGGVVAQGGDLPTLTSAGHRIANNRFFNIAQVRRTYNPAVRISGVGITVAHNRIDHLPHAGIIFSGNEHVIEYNHLSNTALETLDVGVIYAGRSWTARGNLIRYNFIDSSPNAQGVYLDDTFGDVDIYGNVIRGTLEGILIAGGRENTVENNVVIASTRALRAEAICLSWARDHCEPGSPLVEGLNRVPYRSEPWASRYPRLVTILDDEPSIPKYNVIRNNIFIDSGPAEIDDVFTQYGTVADNLERTGGVRLFEEAKHFAIDADVLGQVPGFLPIPFLEIGNYPSVQIESPAPGAVLLRESPVRLKATAEEPLQSVDVRLDGDTIYSGNALPQDLTVGGLELGEGSHVLEVAAAFAGGRESFARAPFTKVNAVFRTVPENPADVRGPLEIDVDTAFSEEQLARVAIHLERLKQDETVERWPLYEGRTLPAPFAFDTLRVSDGDYRLSLHVQAHGGAGGSAAVTFTIHNWTALLHDPIEAPLRSAFLGLVNRRRTVAESEGWTPAVDTPHLFFGDADRIARRADTTEFLVWEAPDFRRFEFTLYAKSDAIRDMSEAIRDTVRVEHSADMSAWRSVEFDVAVLQRNDVWSKIAVTGEVDPGTRFLRLTFVEGGLPADEIQLSAATIFLLRERD